MSTTMPQQVTVPDPVSAPERRQLQFAVKGLPAPQGSKSFKGMSKRGHAILAESSKKVYPWRQDVVIAAENAIDMVPGFRPFSGPVHLVIEFYMPRPKGAPKSRRVVPDVMPDLSKLIRSTEDALKTAAVWRDDSQVVDITTRKRYATFADEQIGLPWELPGTGAVITVIELSHEDTWADTPLDLHAISRHPAAALPAPLAQVPTPALVRTEEWGSGIIVVPADATDSKARQLLAKAAKEVERRVGLAGTDRQVSDSLAVVVEDGVRRLSSPPGKPLSPLQEQVIGLVGNADAHPTNILVILAGAVQ